MMVLNGSDPVDVAYVIIIAVREFMNNHTGDQADENFVNFMRIETRHRSQTKDQS